MAMDETEINIARTLDHTLLRADVTAAEIHQLCQEAMEYGFAGVCVNSTHIAQVAAELAGSNILPVSVVGFPLGACTTETKVFETLEAVRLGAREIDMVINVGWLKSRGANGERDTLTQNKIENEIRAVVKAAGDAPVKVIIETCLLTDGQKIQACLLAKNAGAAFVKTSTGFSTSGATEADVRLMRQTVGPEMGVKASGGIRTAADARKMLAAGANRLGVSASVAIVAESVGESVGNSASQNAADPVKPGY